MSKWWQNFQITLCANFKKSNSLFGICVFCFYMVCCSYVISICILFCVQYMRMWSCGAQKESSISGSQRGTYSLWPQAAGLCRTSTFPISFREVRTERRGTDYLYFMLVDSLPLYLQSLPYCCCHTQKDETETLSFGALNELCVHPENVHTTACRTNMSLLWV